MPASWSARPVRRACSSVQLSVASTMIFTSGPTASRTARTRRASPSGVRFLAEPELDRAEARVGVTTRGRRELVGREAVPQPVARVAREPIAIAAEQAMERLTERLARGVPHGDVERRERGVEETAGPDPVTTTGQAIPYRFRLEDAHADDVLAELARRVSDRRHQIGAWVDDVADAFRAVRRRHAREHVPVRIDHAAPGLPGDPLTPGIGATPNARRLTREEAPTITRIPVLPISYGDALPLLRQLGGPVAPEEWRGALPLTYHTGPGPAAVHLRLEFDWRTVTAYDVIARLQEANAPINGSCAAIITMRRSRRGRPLSGMVALMEEARAVGELARSGQRPRRTIIYAAWDAEEPGLLGSTEWVETHAEELRRHAAIYINSDSNGRGFLRVGGTHILERFVNEIARYVIDPQRRISVAERLRALRMARGGSADERREARERTDLRIAALGSGSDYTPFLQHLGIASLNIGYGGEDGGGSYHSNYDSFEHYTRFGDPNFDYGIALAQTGGRAVLRFANADVLPFEFMNLSETVEKYIRELSRLADDMREETRHRTRLIEERRLEMIADPTETFVVPKPDAPVPYLNFAPLQNSLLRLQESARNYDAATRELTASRREVPVDRRRALDGVLIGTERAMTSNEGLPRRPWFRHQIYAPGFYTGYGVKTLPGVRSHRATELAGSGRANRNRRTDDRAFSWAD